MTMISDIGIGVVVGGGLSWNAAACIPSAVTLTVISDKEINVGFTINGTGQDGHRIYISTDNVTFTEKGTVTGSTATYQATGLTAGTLYYFYVVAYRGSAESTASNTASDTTWTAGEAIVMGDGNTIGWYDFAVENVRKDGSDNVSIWYDKIIGASSFGPELNSGTLTPYDFYLITATKPNYFYTGCQVGDLYQQTSGPPTLDADNRVKKLNGIHLGILTAGQAPLWSADGIIFNGTSNTLRSNTFTYAQPQTIYLVIKQVTWTLLARFVNGAGVDAMEIQQRSTTPGLKINGGGTVSNQNNNLALDTWGIIRVVFNSAASSLQINNTAATTGNYGTTTVNGIVLGANKYAAFNFSNIIVKEAIFRNVADDAETQTKIYNYLSNKYGVG